jgi:hypothetical protein
MALKTRIWRTTASGGQDLAGIFSLSEEGVIEIEGVEPAVLEMILLDDMLTEGGEVVLSIDDPEKWMRALPRNLTGSYLKAEAVSGEAS